jgi:ribokinase
MIVIIGSINMDLVLNVPRYPLPGETLAGGQFRTIPGGKGANQAVACARIGGDNAKVSMIACVGDDPFGVELRTALRNNNIDDSHVSTIVGKPSGVASILVDSDGQNSIVLAGGANDYLSPDHIDAALSLIQQASIVVLQLETPVETVCHAINLAHKLGKIVVLNPAPAKPLELDLLSRVNYLIPNEIEAAMLADLDINKLDKNTIAKSAAEKLRAVGSANVLVTLGEKGVYAALTSESFHSSALPALAVDTTAAGDTFIGGFVASLAKGHSESDAITFGQRAAALSVTRIGAQTSIPYCHELGF